MATRTKAAKATAAAKAAAAKTAAASTTRETAFPKTAAPTEPNEQQRKDAAYARLAEELARDASVPEALKPLAADARVTVRRGGAPDLKDGHCVVYWMQRAQRGADNHALDKAIAVGNALGLPVVAYFAGISNFKSPMWRHYAFLNQGLPDIAEDCAERGVGFVTRYAPNEDHLRFFADVKAAMVIGDENPMRAPESWRVSLAERLHVPFWTVDADVVVPSRLLEKAQYSGAVIRPRVLKRLPEFLKPFENLHAAEPWRMPRGLQHDDPKADMTAGWKGFDRSVKPVEAWHGGRKEAWRRLDEFVTKKLARYAEDRKHPELAGSSRLSPYLHFGHIGPLTIALAVDAAVRKDRKLAEARDSYFNEVLVWRELSVNFCRYVPDYDQITCADRWAQETLAKHDSDKRETLYTLEQMERAETYDELWNAAQRQMIGFGWMPNYLRMLWAKKIVEWTPDAKTAMEWTVYLNDKYFLDGRDPNGYASVAWAVVGKFDRPWPERAIFGKRRYMTSDSAKRKFDAARYIEDVGELPH